MIQSELQSLYDEQNKTRLELKTKIEIANGILAAIKKKTAMSVVIEKVAGAETSNKESKSKATDLSGLLNKLRRKIQ